MRIKQENLGLVLCAAALFTPAALQAQSIVISPGYTTVGVNQTVQYGATVTGLTNTAITWSVSGIKGGNTTYGSITSGAPASDIETRFTPFMFLSATTTPKKQRFPSLPIR